jgi:hypothetical protein
MVPAFPDSGWLVLIIILAIMIVYWARDRD